MAIRLKIDEFAGGLRESGPRGVLRCPACTVNGTACAVERHEARDIKVWMSGEDRRTKFDERLFGFTPKNKVDSLAEISFGLIGCVGAVCDDDGACFMSLASQLPG
jgi:hypothetical protein